MGQKKAKRRKSYNIGPFQRNAMAQLKVHNTILNNMRFRFRVRYAIALIFGKLKGV